MSVRIDAPIVQNVKIKRKQSRVSLFLLTINSQRAEDELTLEQFKPYMLQIAQRMKLDFIKYLEGNVNHIDDVRITPSLEIGGKLRRVHCHMIVRVTHRAKVQIDCDKIRQAMEVYGFSGAHVNVRWLPDESAAYNYLTKYRQDN